MSVRKRTWTTRAGESKEAWIVAYPDSKGVRHIKTFSRKKDADNYAATAKIEVREGVHVPARESITVAEAAEAWIATAVSSGLERSTRDQRRQHVEHHIVPLLGRMKLSQLKAPVVRQFEDALRDKGRSPAMVRKVLVSLGSILADAVERGLAIGNAVRDVRARRGGPKDGARKRKLEVGIDIPTAAEVGKLIAAASATWRPILRAAAFTGLRASELRGLRWVDIDLTNGVLHVRQRADKRRQIGAPKSEAGYRTVPLPPGLVTELRAWKLACPIGPLGLVFPNAAGRIMFYQSLVRDGLQPTMIAAGVTSVVKDDAGLVTAIMPKYTGLHALRHFYASWCINRKADGGLELPAKIVQARLGHSTIGMTLDTYGHMFPRGDDGSELAAGEQAILG
jgi:integrase